MYRLLERPMRVFLVDCPAVAMNASLALTKTYEI